MRIYNALVQEDRDCPVVHAMSECQGRIELPPCGSARPKQISWQCTWKPDRAAALDVAPLPDATWNAASMESAGNLHPVEPRPDIAPHQNLPCCTDSGKLHCDCCPATSLPTAQPSAAACQVRCGKLWVLWVSLECLSSLQVQPCCTNGGPARPPGVSCFTLAPELIRLAVALLDESSLCSMGHASSVLHKQGRHAWRCQLSQR